MSRARELDAKPPVAVEPQKRPDDAESRKDGTTGPLATCFIEQRQNGPDQMYNDIQDDQDAMVKRQVQDNLRRAYDSTLPESGGDRFAALLDRLRDKQAGRARRH